MTGCAPAAPTRDIRPPPRSLPLDDLRTPSPSDNIVRCPTPLESPAVTDQPHDGLFRWTFQTPTNAAALLRSIIPADLRDVIAWDRLTLEPGELPAPAGDDDRRTDLLFSADIPGGRAFIYLLLEHQSTSDRDMVLRMLGYMTRIWERFRASDSGPLPPIFPVVVAHARHGWRAPVAFHDLIVPTPSSIPTLAEATPKFSIVMEDLGQLSNEDLRAKVLGAFATLVLWAMRDARDGRELIANIDHWASEFVQALEAEGGAEALGHLFRYISRSTEGLRFEDLQAKLRGFAPAAEEIAMTIAEDMHKKGLERGLEQGLERGLLLGQRNTLLKQLSLKFGPLGDEVRVRVEQATAADLGLYVERVLTADTIDAVFTSS